MQPGTVRGRPIPRLLLGHPTGNTFSRAAARAFDQVGWLQEFHSCICWDPETPLARLLPPRLAAQMARRAFPEIPLRLQRSHPWREMARLSMPSVPWLKSHEHGPLSLDGVYRSFDRRLARRLPQLIGLCGIYLYEDAALHSFQRAARLGLRRYYDLPIGHWRAGRQLFEEERELQPEWSCTLTGLHDSPAKVERKELELELADRVIVPSAFVRSTLLSAGISPAKISVVPFGSPPPLASPLHPSERQHHSQGPLRVLYVGSLGQRKGLSYALEAVAALGTQVSLTLIGRPTSSNCKPLEAAMRQHHWIPSLPHQQILGQMRQHDVLLLPSLFEGYALVISEALSQALPVLTTPNSGAGESVRDGVEGFIVPIRSSQAIAQRLQQLVDDREQLATMRQACLRRAAQLSWRGYEQGLLQVVGQSLQGVSTPA